ADASENGLPRETSSLFYTQNGSTDEPSKLHGLTLIHRVSDTPRSWGIATNDGLEPIALKIDKSAFSWF
ncbi:MAG: hypothetical protein ACJASV_001550, partial [Pseudorhodobacter sp.]